MPSSDIPINSNLPAASNSPTAVQSIYGRRLSRIHQAKKPKTPMSASAPIRSAAPIFDPAGFEPLVVSHSHTPHKPKKIAGRQINTKNAASNASKSMYISRRYQPADTLARGGRLDSALRGHHRTQRQVRGSFVRCGAGEGSGVFFGHVSIVITLDLYGSPVEGLMD